MERSITTLEGTIAKAALVSSTLGTAKAVHGEQRLKPRNLDTPCLSGSQEGLTPKPFIDYFRPHEFPLSVSLRC